MLKIVAENQYSEENYNVTSCIVKLKKSFLIFITDQEEYGLNNIIMSTPGILEGSKAISSPAPLFGFQNSFLGRSISELCANKMKKPCLLLMNVQGLEKKESFSAKIALKCVKELIEKIEEK